MSNSPANDIFSVEYWRDLEMWVRDCSRSLKTVLIDRSHTTYYWSASETILHRFRII